MAGLSGFVARENIAEPQKYVDLFDRVHRLESVAYRSASIANDMAAILHLSTGLLYAPGASASPDVGNGRFVFIDGEIYEQDELRAQFDDAQDDSVERLIWKLYDRFGDEFTEQIAGEYTIVIFDHESGRLKIFADQLATRPLYYMHTSEGLHFGTEKKSIVAATDTPVDVDPVGLIQVFHHRHNVLGRTTVKNLKKMMPTSVLSFTNGKLTVSESAPLDFRPATGNVDELVEEWTALLRRAVLRRIGTDRRIIISLSGGLDSRMISLSIPRDRRPVWTRTRGVEGSFELEYARAIAERLGFEHFTENPTDYRFSDGIKPIVWRTEGEHTGLYGPTIFTHGIMKAHGDFVAHGALGGVLSGSHIVPQMFAPRSRKAFSEFAYDWYMWRTPAYMRRFFNADFLRRHLPNVKSEFILSHRQFEQDRMIDTHQNWDFYERQPRMTLGIAPIDAHLFEPIMPFCDRDVLDFSCRIPFPLRIAQSLYKTMIYRTGPELRDLPNSGTLSPLKPDPIGNRIEYAKQSARWLRDKVRRKLTPRADTSSHYRPSENLDELLRNDPGFREHIEAFCDSDSCDGDIFNKKGIRDLLDKHYSGAENHAQLIGMLGTYAALLPVLVYNKTLECPDDRQPISRYTPEQ